MESMASKSRPTLTKLHIGCGDRVIPGFVNVDIRPLPHVDIVAEVDALPMIPDESVELIYCSHVLEHVSRGGETKVLREWYRVLSTGGILRIAVPDFDSIVKWYQSTSRIDDVMGLLYGGQTHSYNFHYQVFNFQRLSAVLQSVGFSHIKRYNWAQTVHRDFDDYSQAYLPHFDKTNGLLMSLNVEATK